MDPMEIPQRADRVEESCVDGEMELLAVSKVLDDDNLLPLIMVRVGFPTSLVCAALACKRWLSVASDPAFLRSFRKQHPPNLLGFCVDIVTPSIPIFCRTIHQRSVTFVPILPHPAELAVVVRKLEAYRKREMSSCSSSDELISGFWNMSTERGMSSVLPSPPNEEVHLRELCDVPSMSNATDEDENNAIIRVSQLGDKDDFVLLKIGQCALYLDIKRRALRKVYEVKEKNQCMSDIHPFRTIWPPIFPAPKDDPTRNAT